MKEPKSKKMVLTALIGSILFVILALVSVAYLAGRDVSNENTSASVIEEQEVASESAYSTLIGKVFATQNGNIWMTHKKYIAGGDNVMFTFAYNGDANLFLPAPTWELSICGLQMTVPDSWAVNQTVKVPRVKRCDIEVEVFTGTSNEEGFSYTVSKFDKMKTKPMKNLTYPATITNHTGFSVKSDIASDLSAFGINPVGVNWEYIVNDNCYFRNSDFNSSNPGKTDLTAHFMADREGSKGNCSIKVIATAFSCDNCGTSEKIAYRFSKTIGIKIKANLIPTIADTPTPTSSTIPTTTVTPMPSISPTPSVMTVSFTPTPLNGQ